MIWKWITWFFMQCLFFSTVFGIDKEDCFKVKLNSMKKIRFKLPQGCIEKESQASNRKNVKWQDIELKGLIPIREILDYSEVVSLEPLNPKKSLSKDIGGVVEKWYRVHAIYFGIKYSLIFKECEEEGINIERAISVLIDYLKLIRVCPVTKREFEFSGRRYSGVMYPGEDLMLKYEDSSVYASEFHPCRFEKYLTFLMNVFNIVDDPRNLVLNLKDSSQIRKYLWNVSSAQFYSERLLNNGVYILVYMYPIELDIGAVESVPADLKVYNFVDERVKKTLPVDLYSYISNIIRHYKIHLNCIVYNRGLWLEVENKTDRKDYNLFNVLSLEVSSRLLDFTNKDNIEKLFRSISRKIKVDDIFFERINRNILKLL